jgi:transposase
MNLFVGKRAAELNRKVNMQQMWPPVYVPFKYRLYPFRNQERKLMRQPDELRSLWNYALEQRQHEWKTGRVSVVYAEKCKSLAMWHSNDGSGIGQVYSHVAQECLHRLDRAFKSFFRHIAGYPRFKDEMLSLTYPDAYNGSAVTTDGRAGHARIHARGENCQHLPEGKASSLEET